MSARVLPVRGAAPYDVVVGHDLADRLPAVLGESVQRVAFLYDGTLGELAQPVVDSLSARYDVLALGLPPGEGGKDVSVVADCWEALGAAGFTRSDAVVTFGGGATTDLGGFVAATWLRGVRVVHLPTTLLGMVDAAVGGKTGINTGAGKNLVGAFHEPAGVLCDLDLLRTLPRAELVAGLGEVVKCGFVADPAILDLVESGDPADLTADSPVLRELARRRGRRAPPHRLRPGRAADHLVGRHVRGAARRDEGRQEVAWLAAALRRARRPGPPADPGRTVRGRAARGVRDDGGGPAVMVWVLNGPNLGRLGRRQPEIYGSTTHDELAEACRVWGAELGLDVELRQTNHEGELLDWLNDAADARVPVVLNAGAWTHYSLALFDACAQLEAPLVEVHISDPRQRAEEFRHTSVVEPHAVATIAGRGVQGYRDALALLADA